MKSIMLTLFACLFSLVLVGQPRAVIPCSLTWLPNTEADLSSYNVFEAKTSNGYTAPLRNVNVPNADCSRIGDGLPHFFTVSALDVNGNESGKAVEVSKIFALESNPGAGSVTYSRTTIPMSAVVGGANVSMPLFTITNGTTQPATFTYADALPWFTASLPSGAFVVQPGATQAMTITLRPTAVGTAPGTFTGSGSITSVPGITQPLTFVVTLTSATPPPPADRDGDGIPDASDACPDVKGVAPNGCPPVVPPPPGGLRIISTSPTAVVIEGTLAACPNGLTTSTSGSTALIARRTVKCNP